MFFLHLSLLSSMAMAALQSTRLGCCLFPGQQNTVEPHRSMNSDHQALLGRSTLLPTSLSKCFTKDWLRKITTPAEPPRLPLLCTAVLSIFVELVSTWLNIGSARGLNFLLGWSRQDTISQLELHVKTFSAHRS